MYFEGDDITSVYFYRKGKAGFVLPKSKTMAYLGDEEASDDSDVLDGADSAVCEEEE